MRLAATTIIEALMPNYAQAQQLSKTDDRIKASYVTVPSPLGNGSKADAGLLLDGGRLPLSTTSRQWGSRYSSASPDPAISSGPRRFTYSSSAGELAVWCTTRYWHGDIVLSRSGDVGGAAPSDRASNEPAMGIRLYRLAAFTGMRPM